MAFQYYFCVNEADDSMGLYLNDSTGAYNVSTNQTGYGVVNLSPSDVSVATLTVTFPNLAQAPVTRDVYANLSAPLPYPKLDQSILITNDMLGLSATAKLDDGIYFFQSTISGLDSTRGNIPFSSSNSFYMIFSNQVDAYFDLKTKTLKVPDVGCGCDDEDGFQLERLKNLLRSAKFAACNGQVDNATTIMNYLIKLANCNGGPLTLC